MRESEQIASVKCPVVVVWGVRLRAFVELRVVGRQISRRNRLSDFNKLLFVGGEGGKLARKPPLGAVRVSDVEWGVLDVDVL